MEHTPPARDLPDDAFDDVPDPSYSPEPAAEAPHPINWNLLTAKELRDELLELNRWINWFRREFGIPANEIPPLWHRHPELVWALSSLHLHWLCAYDAEQNGSAPFGFMFRDFPQARDGLRAMVSACGTRRDTDRPTRLATWPGEEPAPEVIEQPITDRDADFATFVTEHVRAREEAEEAFFASIYKESEAMRD